MAPAFRRRAALAVGVSCAALLVACTGTESGSPTTPQAPPGSSPASVPPEVPDLGLPPRPAELPLEGVDPCSLLDENQRAALGIDRPPVYGAPEDSQGLRAPNCNFRRSAEESSFLVTLVSDVSLSEYVASAQGTVPYEPADFAGHPGVLLRREPDAAGNLFCLAGVDVAEGQFMLGSFGQVAPSGPPLPQEVLCTEVTELMGAAVQSLAAKG